MAVAFAPRPPAALNAANAALGTGWSKLAGDYADGWHRYLASLGKPPVSLLSAGERREWWRSEMVLAASEDKTYRGAYIASPSMPWAWGTGLQTPTGPFHLVWARDLYEIATALIADGDNSRTTIGRAWPIFAGERGEYELLAGRSAAARLSAMAAAANDGGLIPEQVWDQNPPSGQPGFPPGTPTTSATPLAWSHAQFIRLAVSIAAGRPVEQPSVVACRYVRPARLGTALDDQSRGRRSWTPARSSYRRIALISPASSP